VQGLSGDKLDVRVEIFHRTVTAKLEANQGVLPESFDKAGEMVAIESSIAAEFLCDFVLAVVDVERCGDNELLHLSCLVCGRFIVMQGRSFWEESLLVCGLPAPGGFTIWARLFRVNRRLRARIVRC